MADYILRKLEEIQIETVWIVLAFFGVIMAIGSRRPGSTTTRIVVNTFCSGIVCGIAAPVVVRDVLGYDSTALLAISAMVASFFGMKFTAVVLGLDPIQVLQTLRGGKK